MFATKVEHFLRFGKTSYERAGDATTLEQKSKCRDSMRLIWGTDKCYVTIAAKKLDVNIDVMVCRNCIEYKVKATNMFFHLMSIVGYDNFISPKASRIILFVL